MCLYSLGMYRYLIIEDDAVNASYIADGLREQGAQVTVCSDGVQGIALAVGEQWDVIVLDRMLPDDFDGLQILQTLRSLGKMTPVLVPDLRTAEEILMDIPQPVLVAPTLTHVANLFK